MSRFPTLALAGLAASLAAGGCANKYGTGPIHDDRGMYNTWTIQTVNDGAVRNAIIAQHTLYPYHFTEYGADLNELGQRDVQVLAAHYKRYAGPVNVRRGPEADAVYQARVKTVVDALKAGGVAEKSIKVADEMPGGEGMGATRVISILENDLRRMQTGASSKTMTGSPTGAPGAGASSSAADSPPAGVGR
jgi:hypothetical protein